MTPADKDKQTAAMDRLASMWNCEMYMFKDTCNVDAKALVCGTTIGIGFIEYKARNLTIDQYPDIMLGYDKWAKLKKLAETTNVPCMFVIEVIGGDLWAAIANNLDPPIVERSGRTKHTRDRWDIEKCALIPTSDFVRCEDVVLGKTSILRNPSDKSDQTKSRPFDRCPLVAPEKPLTLWSEITPQA